VTSLATEVDGQVSLRTAKM